MFARNCFSRQRQRRLLFVAAVAAVGVARSSSNLLADYRFYVGPASGSWTDPANWSYSQGGTPGVGQPVAADNVFLVNNDAINRSVTYDYAGSAISYASVVLDNTGGALTTLNQSANTLTTQSNGFYSAIGSNGNGAWNLSGTAVGNVNGDLFAAQNVGSAGTITLAGTAQLNISGGESVGGYGAGTFIQNGGTHTVGNQLVIGTSGNSPTDPTAAHGTGNYFLHGGVLNVTGNTAVGLYGGSTGQMIQDGGTFTTQNLYLGGQTTAGSGTFTISDSGDVSHPTTLHVTQTLNVGDFGPARFVMNGGSVTFDDAVNIGGIGYGSNDGIHYDDASGTFEMHGGVLNEAYMSIGPGGANADFGTGQFNQDGGVNNVTLSPINVNHDGIYNLSGTGKLVATGPYTGLTIGAAGAVHQTGNSSFIVHGGLRLGDLPGVGAFAGVPGVYTLDSGTLEMDYQEYIGENGDGVFNQNGGTHTVGSTAAPANMYIALNSGSSGVYNLNGGTLALHGNIVIGKNGTINQAAGSNLLLDGTIVGSPTNPPSGTGDKGLGVNPQGTSFGAIRSFGTGTVTDGTSFNNVIYQVEAGTTTDAGTIVFGNGDNSSSVFQVDGGNVNIAGTLGIGNGGTGSSGSSTGAGACNVTGGTVHAGTVVLGNNMGGSGDMTISGSGKVIVGGGLSINDLTLNGGTLTILDQDPPANEDPELNRAIVGGYYKSGAFYVNGGVVTSPIIKLGITSGLTGTYVQTAGSATYGTLAVGDDASATLGAGFGTATLSGGTLSATSLILGSSVGGSGTLTWTGGTMSVANATVARGGRAIWGIGGNLNLKLSTLQIDTTSANNQTGGVFDLADSDLIVGSATVKTTIESYVRNARNGGLWNAPGLSTRLAAPVNGTQQVTGLGVLSGAEYSAASGTNLLFDGLSFSSTDTLVKYTYNGDANFDGKVNANDYGYIDSGYQNQKNAGFVFDWFHGDFDYSGKIDANDYALIDAAYQLQSGTLRAAINYLETGDVNVGTISPSLQQVIEHENEFGPAYANDFIFANVPEPTSVAVGTLILAGFSQRRRRR